MTRILAMAVVLSLTPALVAAAAPQGWFLAGSDPSSYTIDRDVSVTHEAKVSGRLASTGRPKGFGTMMQTFVADEYLGKRLRYSAFVKASNVQNWAGLWMRVDGPDAQKNGSLAFDNMQTRPIKGTKDWAQYSVVLDVPQEAKNLAFGILVDGPGTVWLNNVKFDVVDKSVPTTGPTFLQRQPKNLDFEH